MNTNDSLITTVTTDMAAPSISPQKKHTFPGLYSHIERGSAPSTPNNHPYAIKTTSTAVLTRSNSSSGHAAQFVHAYIPTTPSRSTMQKHRYSKSDVGRATAEPRPLPIPPALESPPKKHTSLERGKASEDLLFPPLRSRRSETLPSAPAPPLPSPVKVDDLPSNPRVWTTSQLASYLMTALRVKSGDSLPLPLPIAKDIALFVKEARLNGRAFLRLNEQDFEALGVNNLWKEALFNASRNLRQNVLKGRIWGFGEEDEKEMATSTPFKHSAFNSSSSSLDESFGSQDTTPSKSTGRVRGLVASLERTCSSDSSTSNHGSFTSEGDSMPGSWADDEAAFASGSEAASDVEERKTRATTVKCLVAEPAQTKILPEIPGEVASPDSEPSVEELLAQESLSRSWGARAWEEADMTMGETIKRIATEDEVAAPELKMEHTGSSSGSRKDNAKDYAKAVTKLQIKDIFSRPLPSRPLPTPPKSGTSSPILQTPITRIPVQIVEKVDQSIQVESESQDESEHDGTDAELVRQESENLQHTLSLLEQFQARLAEVEQKLKDLEHRDAEQALTSLEVPASAAFEPSKATSATESKTIQVEASTVELSPAPTAESESMNASESALSLPLVQLGTRSHTRDNEPSDTDSHRIAKKDWHEYLPHHDWAPLDNGIPHYVLMVGVGVCAVVFTAFLKRLAGKKA